MADSKNWIPVRGAQGVISRQAHADLPDGTYEREISKEGFSGPASFLYHPRPPTGWTKFEGPLRPRAFELSRLSEHRRSPWAAPRLLFNAALEIRAWQLSEPMPALARNADGDQLLFVHAGEGELFCDYGRIAFETGDYLYLPRGTLWRLAPTAPAFFLMVEATNAHYGLPDKGLIGRHALFDPAMLDTPVMDDAFRTHQGIAGEFRIEIKRRGQISVVTYPYNPLDAVGWHGDLAPVRLNIRHFRPMSGHPYHVPPSVGTTFESDRFVVCTFGPRPFETDPGTIKVPFFHNNDDFDEVLFFHGTPGQPGGAMMTFHPSGFTHGPSPQQLKNMLVAPQAMTAGYAVMVDSRDPLEVGEAAASVENAAYVDSWKAPEG